MDFSKLGINIHFPTPNGGGLFGNGVLAGIGALMSYFLMILVLIWIVYSIYAAFKIITSQGAEKDIETGMTLVKNVWVSITWGLAFFAVLSIIGAFIGIGDVTQWYYSLAQCNGSGGGFYFLDRAAADTAGVPTDEFQCCTVIDTKLGPTKQYRELTFPPGSSHYIGVGKGLPPDTNEFKDCTLFK